MSSLQVNKNTAGSIATNDAVIFDEVVENIGSISYDTNTGIITISENGTYVIDWWVSTQSVPASSSVVFNLVSSSSDIFNSNSPIRTGNMDGVAILEITTAPVTLTLNNQTPSIVYFPTVVPVKASLRIFSLESIPSSASDCFEYMQLTNVLSQVVTLYPGATIRVYLSTTSFLEGTIFSIYTPPDTTLQSLLTIFFNGAYFSINIGKISAFSLTNSVYDDSITYLPLPDPFIINCNNIMVPTVFDFVTEGTTIQLLISSATNISGNVFLNEYGMLVLAPVEGTAPLFIVPSYIVYITTLTPSN